MKIRRKLQTTEVAKRSFIVSLHFSLPVGLHCALELDEYGRFDRKARTLPSNTDPTTLSTTWDQDFELEVVGAHMIRVTIFSKYLLKEEVYASGKIRVRELMAPPMP